MVKIYKNIKMPSKMNKAKVDKNRKPCFMQDISFIVFFSRFSLSKNIITAQKEAFTP